MTGAPTPRYEDGDQITHSLAGNAVERTDVSQRGSE